MPHDVRAGKVSTSDHRLSLQGWQLGKEKTDWFYLFIYFLMLSIHDMRPIMAF